MKKKINYKLYSIPDNLEVSVLKNSEFVDNIKETLLFILLKKHEINQWQYDKVLSELKKGG